jgi:hypothetical protein
MKEVTFFLAFLGAFWILVLVFGTLTGHFDKTNRDSIKDRYEWYKTQQKVSMVPVKLLFYFFNGHALFPVQGFVVSLIFVLIFIFTN